MPTTYTTGTPVPTNTPSQDVQNMQNNSIAINEWVQRDHAGFNKATFGQHNQITFPTTITGPATPPWAATGTNNGPSQIFPQTFSTSEQLYYADNDSGRASVNRLVLTPFCVGSATWDNNAGKWTQNTGPGDYNVNCTVSNIIPTPIGSAFIVKFTKSPIGWNYMPFFSTTNAQALAIRYQQLVQTESLVVLSAVANHLTRVNWFFL